MNLIVLEESYEGMLVRRAAKEEDWLSLQKPI